MCLFAFAVSESTIVLAQVAAPRTVTDIVKTLETYRPDPAAVERIRALASEEPPKTEDRQALASFYFERSRAAFNIGLHAQAAADMRQAADLYGRGHTMRLRALMDVAIFNWRGGDFAAAIVATEQSKSEAASRNMYGFVLSAASIEVGIYAAAGDLENARRALSQSETAWATFSSRNQGPELSVHINRYTIEGTRSIVLMTEGKWTDAEAAERRALDAARMAVRSYPNHPAPNLLTRDVAVALLGTSLERLSVILAAQGRLSEAEAAAREALQVTLENFGRYHAETSARLQQLALILIEQGRTLDAVVMAEQSLHSIEQSGATGGLRRLAAARRSLAAALVAAGKHEAAVRMFEQYREGVKTDRYLSGQLPAGDLDWVIALVRTGRLDEAQRLIEAMREWNRKRFEERDDRVAWVRGYYGVVLAAKGERAQAFAEFQAAVPQLIEIKRRAAVADGGSVRQTQRLVIVLEAYIELLAAAEPATQEAISEAFRVAEAARGGIVQRTLSASTARASARDPQLVELARREQETGWRIESLGGILSRLVADPPERQLPKVIADIRRDIESLNRQQSELRQEIARRFPDFADLVNPKPATVGEVQAVLRPSETMVAIYVGDQASYVWAIPKQGPLRFVRAGIGAVEMARRVAHLRTALDVSGAQISDISAFDVNAAAQLYDALLRPVQDVWKAAPGLVVVSHGPLAQLSLAVLVTAQAPTGSVEAVPFERYRSVAWLAREASVAQMPSAGSLVSLRRATPPAATRRSFVGFGDPVFAKTANVEPRPVADVALRLAVRSAPKLDKVDSAGLALLPPLPDTSQEVLELARMLGADLTRDVYLREAASEKTLFGLDLTEPRIIAFATHGLVPGDLNGLTQPALALSSPEVAGGDGDGLLTMEEVLGLKLNADWVVLSACNTAAGAGAGAEAVSGLGRAFFYAGARALLVSNWPVETRSARSLMVDTFSRYAKEGSKRKSAALREAMLAMIDGEGYVDPATGKPLYRYAHPLFWAPFVVVGD
ncbi:MAG: CHAT domain-containing protein [Burkholderiales bacterium]|nr:CHAT domain-containing protein [Burkholderiales bacterium]